MYNLILIGIGTGNPDHLTLEAIAAMQAADLILIPHKGEEKADLAELRLALCERFLTGKAARIAGFDMPVRDAGRADYRGGVDDWHDAIAARWTQTLANHLPGGSGRAALLIWGDPALYDSSLRITRRLPGAVRVTCIPGIMSLNALTAAHAIPINAIGEPFLVTTGRHLRQHGWPAGVGTVAVMLDGECSFRVLAPEGVAIWWGAYLGMERQMLLSGPLADIAPKIVAARAAARDAHGWIMDIYLMRRD